MQLEILPTPALETPLLSYEEPQTLIQEEENKLDEETGLATSSSNREQKTFLQLRRERCVEYLKNIFYCWQRLSAERRCFVSFLLVLIGTVAVTGHLFGAFTSKLYTKAKVSCLGYFAHNFNSGNLWITNYNKINH